MLPLAASTLAEKEARRLPSIWGGIFHVLQFRPGIGIMGFGNTAGDALSGDGKGYEYLFTLIGPDPEFAKGQIVNHKVLIYGHSIW